MGHDTTEYMLYPHLYNNMCSSSFVFFFVSEYSHNFDISSVTTKWSRAGYSVSAVLPSDVRWADLALDCNYELQNNDEHWKTSPTETIAIRPLYIPSPRSLVSQTIIRITTNPVFFEISLFP